MPETPIEMRIQVLPWDDLINVVETKATEDEGGCETLWQILDEIQQRAPVAKN